MTSRKKTIIACFMVLAAFVTISPAQADFLDDSKYVNEYISEAKLDKSDKLIAAAASPEVVFSVLMGFAVLVVIVVYLAAASIIFLAFFSNFM